MLEIGFWRRFEDESVDPEDFRPWPTPYNKTYNETDQTDDKELIIEYLGLGYIESYEFGYATCRLCGYHCDEMGCCSLSDGIYVWPEGLKHYISQHQIILNDTFIQHIKTNIDSMREHHRNKKVTDEELSILEWRENEKLRIMSSDDGSKSNHYFTDMCCFCF